VNLTYRCDICGGLADIALYRHGTLFGRPMRCCAACRAFLNYTKQREDAALSINFGLSEDMEPALGLAKVKELEQQKAGEINEMERTALCRLRFWFERRLVERS
jgi:hypothetical protein